MTLQERLRRSTALNGWIDYEAIDEAADALDAKDARIKELEGALKDERKRLTECLNERDYNGKMWRHFEILCNRAGCWEAIK